MIQELKDFINRGNVIDLAVAFVMGAAFAPVVSAITGRVLMPLIALMFGEPDFDTILTFGEIDPETGLAAGSVGAVITALVNFLLVAVALFFVVKAYNRMKARKADAELDPTVEPEDIVLLREIRDALARR